MSGLRGKISSVSLKDFVTYDYVTFHPGQYLNIIIGPNGTGKSTLVAAIVLGMGGSPKVLSRALNIGDYVKNGKQTAIITIGIYRATNDRDTTDVVVFQREFDLDGTSRFLMDGRKCTQAAFLRAVSDLNIQVDNLCQFLPQDRVQDFAKMNAHDLLISTQCSVCAPEVEKAWHSLCDMRQRQKTQSSSRAENAERLAECERLNAALEQQIEAMHKRTELAHSYEMCAKKKAWMEFEELYIKHQELTEDLRKAKENLQRHETEMRPLQQQIDAIDAAKATFERDIRTNGDAADRQATLLDQLADRASVLHADMRKARADYDFAVAGNDERQQERVKAIGIQQVLIADLKSQQATAGSDAERRAAVAALDGRIRESRTEVQQLLAQRHEIGERLHASVKPQLVNAQTRIRTMENVGDRKLELLRSRNEHAYRGVLWLRENAHLFQGKVYEPMVLELNVKDPRNAKYVENSANTRDLVAFTCEQKEDMEVMHRQLRGVQKLNVNLIHSAPAERLQFCAQKPIEELAQYGFHSYVIDLIEGPAPLLNALCKNNRLHMVPVGNDRTFEMADKLPADIGLFFSTNHRFQITQSKYSKQTSSNCNEIQTNNLLSAGVDAAQMERLKQTHAKLLRESDTLNNERVQLENALRQREDACAQLETERQAIVALGTAVDECKEKLRRHMKRVERLPQPIDLREEQQKMIDTTRRLWKETVALQLKKLPAFQALCTARTERDLHTERFAKFQHDNHALHLDLRQRQDEATKARRLVTRIGDLHERNKRDCKQKQSAAKALTDGKSPSDAATFPYREAFDALPGLMEELLQHMNQLQGEIDCLPGDGEAVMAEFQQRRQQIEQLRDSIANHEQQAQQLTTQMDELHAKWYPIVAGTVAVINENFGKYMSAMRFAGEVLLTHGDLREYSEYGIDIRVKYRSAERLQTLDRNVQSGGERAVAIAVYSLSLQQISNVPFRCVDEINQGMDATNERKIFDMLVAETDGVGKSQYFFVTPKLLPNLAYNDAMTVHVVHNGRFVTDERMFERRWV